MAHLLSVQTARARTGQDAGSRFSGVQIGIIAPYAFHGIANTVEDIHDNLLDLGISAVEMKSEPVERFAGAPRQDAERLGSWRSSVAMDRFTEIRQMYDDAGIRIYAFKLGLNPSMPDEEYDYCFRVAKILGADHVTMELNDRITARVGRFAAKHEIQVAYHNHTEVDEHSWDAALEQSDYNGINLDVGHFTAGISKSPIPFIQKHHARIRSMHFKDRKYGTNGSTNMPWGEGDTPLREVLQLMKKEQYPFPATIELEYAVPEGSSVKTELAKCLQFCKDALA
jgi:sugar phosphate isomerase/epimerase